MPENHPYLFVSIRIDISPSYLPSPAFALLLEFIKRSMADEITHSRLPADRSRQRTEKSFGEFLER
jgi:hypothetical protein